MKRFVVAILGAAGTLAAFGAQYFVDADNGNDGWNGEAAVHQEGTSVGPKRTIQAAVGLADGTTATTISVAPGVYGADQGATSVDGNGTLNRLVIDKANVTIVATGGKEDTHIVGARDDSVAFGQGPNAVRCIYVKTVAPATLYQGIVIKGFTIRDGATYGAGTGANGGAMFCESDSGSRTDKGGALLVDCVVSNCVATRGAALYRGAAYRTLIADNHATCGVRSGGSATDFGSLKSCIVANNHGGCALWSPVAVVGCTVYGNSDGVIGNRYNTDSVFNCLLISNVGNNGFVTGGTDANAPGVVSSVVAGAANLPVTSGGTKSGAGIRDEQCVSTALGDVRLFSDSDAVGAGDASLLTKVKLPTGYEETDYFGQALPSAGVIDAGAVQAAPVARPATRLVRFKDAAFTVDGRLAGPETYFYESDDAPWPKAYELGVRFSSGERCYCVYIDGEARGNYTYNRPLRYDGRVSVVLPPVSNVLSDVVIRARAASRVAYANPDATKASDSYDGLAAAYDGTHGPKLTLQAAAVVATASGNYGLVLAASGVYDKGGAAGPSGEGGQTNRVYVGKTVGIIAQDGPGTATIKGAPDPVTGTVGPGAIRAAWLVRDSYVQGFKITSSYGNGEEKYYSKAAVYMGSGDGSKIVDCEVCGNYAWTAPGMFYGTAERTTFHDNHALCAASGSIFEFGWLVSCVCYDNEIPGDGDSALLKNSARLYGCTVDAGGAKLSTDWSTVRGNAIVNAVTASSAGTDNLVNRDCHFANAADHDYRIGASSPAVGRVTAEHFAQKDYSLYVTGDIDGRALAVTADGAVTAGAYHTALPYAVFLPADGSVEVTGGARVGTNVLAGPIEVTVEAKDTTRPFAGILRNGESLGAAWSQRVSLSGTETVEIVADYGTNWYVNVATGADANGGGSAANPKASLKGAAQHAASGDVIHVARGTYRTETMLHDKKCDYNTTEITIPARLWIKQGVSVVSDEGADVTFIEGAAATDGTDAGLGADAVRGVVMDNNTRLVGFTVTKGHTGTTYGEYDDCTGGGIIAKSYVSSVVENCVISNNAALRSGGAHKCRLVNCRILDNVATRAGSVGRECAYVQCLIDGNVGTNAVMYYSIMDFCTVGAGNVLPSGKSTEVIIDNLNNKNPVRNCLLLSPKVHEWVTNLQHCAFIAGAVKNVSATVDCISTNAEALAVDAEYRPVVGSNAAIDAAVSDPADVPSADLSGFQRVMNGAVDVGALEADWRPAYARKLCGGRFACLSAEPCVRLTDDGVALNGGSLALRTVQDVPPGGLPLNVAWQGSLQMTLDGVSVDPASATGLGPGLHDIAFAGEAEILRCRIQRGLIMSVR